MKNRQIERPFESYSSIGVCMTYDEFEDFVITQTIMRGASSDDIEIVLVELGPLFADDINLQLYDKRYAERHSREGTYRLIFEIKQTSQIREHLERYKNRMLETKDDFARDNANAFAFASNKQLTLPKKITNQRIEI